MIRILPTIIIAAGCLAAATNAHAAKKCNIVYPFTDSLGSSGKFVSEHKGIVSNSAICPVPYNLTVTKLTNTVIDISGKTKANKCGALTGSFTFNDGGCDSASGSVTIVGLGTFNDTVTRTQSARHAPVADTSALTNNLK